MLVRWFLGRVSASILRFLKNLRGMVLISLGLNSLLLQVCNSKEGAVRMRGWIPWKTSSRWRECLWFLLLMILLLSLRTHFSLLLLQSLSMLIFAILISLLEKLLEIFYRWRFCTFYRCGWSYILSCLRKQVEFLNRRLVYGLWLLVRSYGQHFAVLIVIILVGPTQGVDFLVFFCYLWRPWGRFWWRLGLCSRCCCHLVNKYWSFIAFRSYRLRGVMRLSTSSLIGRLLLMIMFHLFLFKAIPTNFAHMPVKGNHLALLVLVWLDLTQFVSNDFNVLICFFEKLIVDLVHLRWNVVAISAMLFVRTTTSFIRHDRWGHVENILLAGFQK